MTTPRTSQRTTDARTIRALLAIVSALLIVGGTAALVLDYLGWLVEPLSYAGAPPGYFRGRSYGLDAPTIVALAVIVAGVALSIVAWFIARRCAAAQASHSPQGNVPPARGWSTPPDQAAIPEPPPPSSTVIPATPTSARGWRTVGAITMFCASSVAFLYGGLTLVGFMLWTSDPSIVDLEPFHNRIGLAVAFGVLALIVGVALIVLASRLITLRRRRWRFNTPPGWPAPPVGWISNTPVVVPPTWPAAPTGWRFWVDSRDQLPSPS